MIKQIIYSTITFTVYGQSYSSTVVKYVHYLYEALNLISGITAQKYKLKNQGTEW